MPDLDEALPSLAQRAWTRHDVIVSGVVAGVLGGIVMALFLAVCALEAGMDPLHPLRVIGSTFGGPEALEGGGGVVAFGAALHLTTSALFGVVLAALIPRDFPSGCAIGVGAAYGLFTLGVMMSVVVPAVNPLFRPEMQPVGGSWVIAHVLYGLALGFVPALRRRLAREAVEEQAKEVARRRAAPERRHVAHPT